ncbi:hypothetical protein KAS79_04120 [Candidatus Parcubacteria bacterium]|nr:hypothetical protein [Candidatus Parcubacteria bacterium]
MPKGIYKRKKGIKYGMTGKFHSDTTKRKMKKSHKGMLGKKLSKKHKEKISEKHKGMHTEEKNCNWKGDKASKGAMHFWIIGQKGKASEYKCKYCLKQARDWANVDHTYKRILEDYIPLCRSCHSKYDIKYNNINHTPYTIKNKI